MAHCRLENCLTENRKKLDSKMCDIETENLINLSVEDTEQVPKENDNKLPASLPFIPSPDGRLDNNPFDLVQRLSTCRQDDPFDVVEKEASLKAQQSLSRTCNDVKIGNLLSLSSENEFVDLDSGQASGFSCTSTIYQTADAIELENESPPITVSTKWTPDSSTADSGGTGLSCDSSDSSTKQPNSFRNRKLRHFRNRLLKISISNSSTYGTPSSSRKLTDGEFSKIMSIGYQNDEHMISSESPLKSMYEDIMSEQPPESIYTEKDFDADLELMQIPMLSQIESPIVAASKGLKENQKQEPAEKERTSELNNISTVGPLPDIESLRLKLRAKRTETNNNHDIQDLITNLKTLICESNIVDEQKKVEVNGLLETLSSTLTTTAPIKQEPAPQSIIRQGTFNFDLHKNNEPEKPEDIGAVKANEENEVLIHEQQQQQPIEKIPDVMMRSSATYDGETAEDKDYLNLPQIDPPSPPKENLQHNLNDIMEQLQHLLEQHQLASSKEQTEMNNSFQSNGLSAVGNNPTFIVVMPTISHEESNDLNDYNQISTAMRRRSQSLSIHDKLKIVQLPIKPSPDTNSTGSYNSPPLSAENTSTIDTDGSDFKTPARFLPRRNSFSSATPHTPMRYSRFNNSTADKRHNHGSDSMTQSFASPARLLNIMDTHNESQLTQTLPRPNIGLIKPDPKKKVKTTTSIVKSTGPLKATLPVKKIAPNIKTDSRSVTSNTSMHLLAKSGHISNTSTPMPDIRSNGLNVIGKAIPNACSTPAVYVPSPSKNTAHAARYSNLSTTPIGKATSTIAVSATNLRRRTISEFKAKSPMKTRSSGMASMVNSASGLAKTNLTKSNQLRPTSNLKTSNTRFSVNGTSSYLANRNKENKRP